MRSVPAGIPLRPAADPSYFGFAPPPPQCTVESMKPSCDGDTLVQCLGGRVVRTACPDGLGCHREGSRAECVNYPCPGGDKCAAESITTCIAGRVERINCLALGFNGCKAIGRMGVCIR